MKTYFEGSMNGISKIILKVVSSNETFLEQAKKEKKEKVPFLIRNKYDVITRTYETHEFHTINHQAKTNKHIVYFHGGALCLNGSISHWIMIDKWVKATDAKATYIMYPMIPDYKTHDIYQISFNMYKHLLDLYPDDEMFLIGDSAGALVILSMMQLIQKEKINKPQSLILLSPWLDYSLSNSDMKDYEHKDRVLAISRFKGMESYDSIGDKNQFVSPMVYPYEDSIHIYAGHEDILFPDMLLFEERNPDVNLKIFKECPHVFPLLPLKQSSIVHKEIINIIKNHE